MVTDNRSAGPWRPINYEGYDPLPITALKVHILSDPESDKEDGLLRIITENGIEGWCNEIDRETARILTSQFQQDLIGRDALERERLWHELLMRERLTWPPKKLRGAIDVALWDIAGKQFELPVWRLLGACRDKVAAYRTQSGTMGPEGLEKEHFIKFALQVKEEGYVGSKDHCYAGPKFMIELASELRDAVGPEFQLMHDAVGYYDVKEAIRVGRALEKNNFSWFEEPLRDQDFIGYKQVRNALEIPVVGGEYFPHQLHSYAQMLALGAVDAIKPAIDMGGITEMIKLAQLTFSFGATLHVSAHSHMWGFSSINVNGAIANGSILEVHPPFEAHTNPAIKNPLRLSDGHVAMPESPGLGVDLDWDTIENMTTEIIE